MVNKGVSEDELEGVEAAISSSEGTFKSTLRPATLGEQIWRFKESLPQFLPFPSIASKLKSTENKSVCARAAIIKTLKNTSSKQGWIIRQVLGIIPSY